MKKSREVWKLGATAAAALLLIAAGTASGALVVYESFNYTSGTANPDPDGGVNNGNGLPYDNTGGNPSGSSTGLRNAWLGSTVASGSLSHGSALPSSGNSLAIAANQNQNPATVWLYRNMTADPYSSYRSEASANGFGADGQTIWGSLLVNIATLNNGRFQLRLEGQEGSAYTQIRITAEAGQTYWSLAQTNTSAAVAPGSSVVVNQAVAIVTGVTNLLVWQHVFGTGTGSTGKDTFSLWINPSPGNLGTANYVLTTDAEVGFFGVGYDTRVTTEATIDELRIGTAMADVIPEPGTIGMLLGAGGLMLLRRRPRRA